jgi:hypothetical protein
MAVAMSRDMGKHTQKKIHPPKKGEKIIFFPFSHSFSVMNIYD